jgi:hypothetical protein
MVQESREEVTLFNHHRLLRNLIDPEHPLVKLAESIDWESLEEELKEAYPFGKTQTCIDGERA